jgi:G3E family GTPase
MSAGARGPQVAVVVNDLASVNIDARLIAPGAFAPGESRALGDALVEPSDVVRLQNGCACCAASEELLEGVLKVPCPPPSSSSSPALHHKHVVPPL